MTTRLHGSTALALLIACALVGATSAHASVTCAVRTIREAAAAGPESAARAGIQATVDAFRADLGDPNNGNAVGTQPAGRRLITWDGADNDSAPARFPADFFNAIAPRGAILGGDPRIQFQQSADGAGNNPTNTPAEFGNINATYPTAFATFSSPRLFAALTTNVLTVDFVIAGATDPAGVTGFGAVFTDVDVAGSSRLRFFDGEGVLIFERAVLASPGNESLSFVGVSFAGHCLGRVEVTAGAAALGPNDVTQTAGNPDVVALDDFIYGEPRPFAATVAVGAGAKAPRAGLLDGRTAASLVDVTAFDPKKVKKGVSVAVGDVNGDGTVDLVTGSGPGTPAHVRVFDGVTGAQLHEIVPFDPGFKGGVNVAVGNVNGDPSVDIIVGQGKGGLVTVLNGANPSSPPLGTITAYAGKVPGGVRVAAGDVNGDFLDDVVTIPGKGVEGRLRAFNAVQLNVPAPVPLIDVVALPHRKGAFVAVGDVSGDGVLDFVLGNDAGQAPEVRVFSGGGVTPLANLFGAVQVFPSRFKGGVRVAVGDVNGNGTADLVVGSGKGGKPTTVRVFDPSGADSGPLLDFRPYGDADKSGVFVGAIAR